MLLRPSTPGGDDMRFATAFWLCIGAASCGVRCAALAQPLAARAVLEQAAQAMGGLERLRSLDNVVLTGFGMYASALGGQDLSPDPHSPGKWAAATDAQRTFDLKNERALYQDRRGNMFPFAAVGNSNRNRQLQTGVATLDHPLTALLEALDPETKLGSVRVEDGLQVVELTIEQ